MAFEYHSAAAENLFPEILPSNTNLIHYANRFGSKKYPPPLPLRRTFSILRNYGFGTIVTERSVWEIENGDYKNELCKKSNCGNRYDSCEEYIKSLENFYKKKLLKKECYRIAFFKSEFSDRGQIDGIKEGDLIAFCIVQRDTLRNKVKVDEQTPYVTESIIDLPEKRGNIFFINRSERTLSVCGRIFRISGNYFSQQNRITNCCAHASIKMAIRGFYPEATAETIHKAAANSHIALKGNDGFTPDQFVRAIRGLSGQKAKYFEARTLETSLHFLKLIYHAIESRFPVILLFTHEGAQTFPSHQACHAATLIGHTFNKNTWWAYAWRGYFPSSYGYLQYLPSVMWCDTFIIQDDNLGPYYRLPLHSLKITEMPKIIPDSIKRFTWLCTIFQ